MPGVVEAEGSVLPKGSPSRKSRLSLKFFQKKETKRALDFIEPPESEPKGAGEAGPEICDQVVPAAHPSSPACCERKEKLPPFAGLNNLGNTCYLNSILQVLYYCPGFATGVKYLNNIIVKKKELLKNEKDQKDKAGCKEALSTSYELICSLHCLILSVEQLQVSYLLNPEKYTDELAAPPRRLLNTLRELNPMYEGYLQHDAQEVLQCILGYIRESSQMLKKEELKSIPTDESTSQLLQKPNHVESNGMSGSEKVVDEPAIRGQYDLHVAVSEEELKIENGKRKSDTEVGNERKKTKVTKEQKPVQESRLTRSKRKSSGEKLENQKEPDAKSCTEMGSATPSQKKSRLGLNLLKSSGQQPSILSKFCSLGKFTRIGGKGQPKEPANFELQEDSKCEHPKENGQKPPSLVETVTAEKETQKIPTKVEPTGFELVESLFQGQLVLRTRCLECESFTERREDFQDISVPVQEDELSKRAEGSEISPEPKTETKTLKWAISQFASVERIVGEDKYFCENCHHYTEAERSLLFDKMPEVITIHLKCFAANGLEFDCYGGLSKVNTPLLTPLKLSLEEWSTKPTNDLYELFAVVMHSGITIGSGHYTAYVKITDISSLQLDKNVIVNQMHDMIKPEPLNEEEARAAEEYYDDGEVSFKVSGNGQLPDKVPCKKNIEAIGLLGGQKSKMDCEFCFNKSLNSEKAVVMLSGNKHLGCPSVHGTLESESMTQDGNPNAASQTSELEKKALDALQSLKEYEGKWLLFDDSEVRITEEKDFLTSLSPSTSSSTPYLLFYKRITE